MEEQRFEIDNIDKAEWAIEKIAEAKAAAQEIDRRYNVKLKRLNEWKEQELEESNSSAAYFENLLIEYYIREKEKNSKFKLNSEYGAVASRKVKQYNFDEDEAINWLTKNNSDALRVKTEIDKVKFKSLYKDGIDKNTGELVPGVNIEETIKYNVKIKELEANE